MYLRLIIIKNIYIYINSGLIDHKTAKFLSVFTFFFILIIKNISNNNNI